MLNSMMLNRGLLNGPRSSTATSTGAHATKAYRLEVHSADGAVLGLLSGWRDAPYEATVNTFSTLSLSLPYTAASWELFDYGPNGTKMPPQIWLYDMYGALMEKFYLCKRKKRDTGSELIIAVEANSLLWQLGREPIDNFEAGNERQLITTSATGGTFTLSFLDRGDDDETSSLAYNESTSSLQAKLEALTPIGSGSVAVSGEPGAWIVDFGGDLAERKLRPLFARTAELTGDDTHVKVTRTRETRTVREIVNYLLNNFQRSSFPIFLGSIDASIANENHAVQFQNSASILSCLNQLRETFGGYMYVDPETRRLHWKRRIGQDNGQYIRLRKNATECEIEEDFTEMATRIRALGRGISAQTKLESVVNSGNQGTYGIIEQIVSASDIYDEDDLEGFATAMLNAKKVPKKAFAVGAIDLSALKPTEYRILSYECGSKIRLIAEEFGEEKNTTIGSVKRELDTPGAVVITCTDPDAGTTEWGGNEPNFGGAETNDAADTIADLIASTLDSGSSFQDDLRELLPDVIGESGPGDPFYDSLQNMFGNAIALSSAAPPAIAAAGAAGSDSKAARSDHTHAQQPDVLKNYSRADKSTLDALSGTANSEHAYAQDVHIPFTRVNGAWVDYTCHVAANWGALPTSTNNKVRAGSRGRAADTGIEYVYSGSAWVVAGGIFRMDTAPTSGANGLRRDDLWMDTTEHRLKQWDNTTWLVFPLINPSSNVTKKPADLAEASGVVSAYINSTTAKKVTNI